MVATGFWSSLVHRVASGQTRAHLAQDAPGAVGIESLRLAGALQPLDRLATVRAGTVALLFAAGMPPQLQVPGDHLRPRLRSTRDPTQVLVLSMAPVALDVSTDQLRTLDGSDIDNTVIRVTVQLAADDGHRALLDLAAEFANDLEAELLRQLHREVLAAARTAVGMNRLADVRRLTLTELLASRWLPESFAGGVLARRDVAVADLDTELVPSWFRQAPASQQQIEQGLTVGSPADREADVGVHPMSQIGPTR